MYIEGSQVNVYKHIVFLSLKRDFVIGNIADLDEITHCAVFCLGLHCLPL